MPKTGRPMPSTQEKPKKKWCLAVPLWAYMFLPRLLLRYLPHETREGCAEIKRRCHANFPIEALGGAPYGARELMLGGGRNGAAVPCEISHWGFRRRSLLWGRETCEGCAEMWRRCRANFPAGALGRDPPASSWSHIYTHTLHPLSRSLALSPSLELYMEEGEVNNNTWRMRRRQAFLKGWTATARQGCVGRGQ